MGVISTDLETPGHSGVLREAFGERWLHPGTPDPVESIRQMTGEALSPGPTQTSVSEYGRLAAFKALTDEAGPGRPNEGFYRQDDRAAYLHITVVTDEDDDSGERGLSADDFARWLLEQKSPRSRVSFNSVVSWVDQAGNERGDSYMYVSDVVGGTVVSLHTVDWRSMMAAMAGAQAPEPATLFFLSRLPYIDTIEVRARTAEGVTLAWQKEDGQWAYDPVQNAVRFLTKDAPPIGSEVQLTYFVRAGPREE